MDGLVYFTISLSSSSISIRLSTTIVYHSRFGCIRSAWFSLAFIATHSRKNGTNGNLYSFANFGKRLSYSVLYSTPRLYGAIIPAKRIGIFLAWIFSMIALILVSISATDLPWNASLAPIQRMMRLGVSHSSTQSRRERSAAVVSHDIPAFSTRYAYPSESSRPWSWLG